MSCLTVYEFIGRAKIYIDKFEAIYTGEVDMYGNACGVGVAVRAGPADLDPTHARKRTEKHQGTFFNHQPHGIGRSFIVH